MSSRVYDALRLPWPTDWIGLFGRDGPLVVEVGFGNGGYLLDIAASQPKANVIGLEISNRSLKNGEKKLSREGQDNILLVRARANMFLWLLCDKATVSGIIINFPDPWPKASHSHRRLVNTRFLNLAASRMDISGVIQIATDHSDYASSISMALMHSPYFDNMLGANYSTDTRHRVNSKYEAKAIHDGRPCYYFKWRRNKIKVANEFPIIEELDMPHAVVYTPLTLKDMNRRFKPGEWTSEVGTVRIIDMFYSRRRKSGVIDAYVREGDLEQRVMLAVKSRKNSVYIIYLHETGHPRPTPATQFAILCLAEILANMHPEAVVRQHNLGTATGGF